MRRGITALIFVVLLSSFISADIIFNQQFQQVYNLGDDIDIPITISSLNDVSGTLKINLICNGTAVNILTWNELGLKVGHPKEIPYSFRLVKDAIGGSRGTCNIQAIFGSDNTDTQVSPEFKISDQLNIESTLKRTEFNPGEVIEISGKVMRENGENANGFIDADIITEDINQNITQAGAIIEGVFSMNVSLPSNIKAGSYTINLNAYEKDFKDIITNTGTSQQDISVLQFPTNLEVILENNEINPGESLKIKAILHDQTGEQLNSTAFITIKDNTDKILEQEEVQTGEVMEYSTKFNQPPVEWKIFAISSKISAEETFRIKEKEDISLEIVNKTILVTNTGNVPYNRTLLVKVGDTPLNIQVELEVNESRKYVLTAPDGDYNVEIASSDGENKFSDTMSLTGNAVDIKEVSGNSLKATAWIILFLILAVSAYIIFKKVRRKKFFGHVNRRKREFREMPVLKDNSIKTSNKAELSLSIKGEKQDVSIICLRIKNLKEMRYGRGSAAESIRKAMDIAEENNAVVYENQDYLFFIFAPSRTRTFKNEKTALDVAENIEAILKEHNKMFNQKMNFGISLHNGTIVAKTENGIFAFMSMGTMITAAKKIASLAGEEILLSDKINDMLRTYARTEKNIREGVPVFIVKEVKRENEEARKFIEKFMNRQGK